jgi:hypothetical protein
MMLAAGPEELEEVIARSANAEWRPDHSSTCDGSRHTHDRV